MDIQQFISSGIIEMYAMGLCIPEEERELEQLRSQHPEVDKAITDYEGVLEKNMMQHVELPGDATDNRILDTLEKLGKPVPVVTMQPHKLNWLKPFAAAASILLLLSAGLNYYLYRQSQKPLPVAPVAAVTTLPVHDYNVLNNPKITPVAMYGVGYHSICRCTMFWDKQTRKMYIMIHHLPQSSAQQDYQLWAIVDGKPVSVGIIQDEIRGRFIEMKNVPANAASFIVTLEKAGGAAAPNTDETYLDGKI